MNCTRVQELLPLYVGADLAACAAEGVRAHLETCATCRELAEEFAASTAWLQAAPTPEFDEAFFAALRGEVQQAIAQTALRPSWVERWWPAANWRWLWVPVLAALLLALALNWQRQRALPATQPDKVIANESGPAPVPEPQRPQSELAVQDSPRSKQRRAFQRKETSQQKATVDYAQARPTPSVQTQFPKPAAPAVGEAMLATAPEVTRIEIQTADPNIRIIWLTQKPQNTSTNSTEPLNR